MDNNVPSMPLPNQGETPTEPQAQVGPNSMPMVQQVQAPATLKKDISGLIKTIVIIILALLSLAFIGLFIWKQLELTEAQADVQDQIEIAVAEAKDEQAAKLEAEFLEREKYPYKTFSGPVDYGKLTFEYPRDWSVYIAKAATTGGDFNAYFNPDQVDAVGKETINALRVTIQNKSYESVVEQYQRYVDRKNSDLDVQSITINDIAGNRYTGNIPNTDLQGIIFIFKIRDKTVILQTDSMLFEADFNKLLETVTFNA